MGDNYSQSDDENANRQETTQWPLVTITAGYPPLSDVTIYNAIHSSPQSKKMSLIAMIEYDSMMSSVDCMLCFKRVMLREVQYSHGVNGPHAQMVAHFSAA